jgi:hypothetical protein
MDASQVVAYVRPGEEEQPVPNLTRERSNLLIKL